MYRVYQNLSTRSRGCKGPLDEGDLHIILFSIFQAERMISVLRIQLSSCQGHFEAVESTSTGSVWIRGAGNSLKFYCCFLPVLVVALFVLVADDWEVVHAAEDVRYVESQCGALEHFHVSQARPRVLSGNVARSLQDHCRWRLLSSSCKFSLEEQVVKRSGVGEVNHCVTATTL